jgi:hypothetical protein
MIRLNDKIVNKKNSTIHIVEHMETVSGINVIYTTDSKCFPISEIHLASDVELIVNQFFKPFKENEAFECYEKIFLELSKNNKRKMKNKFKFMTLLKKCICLSSR